MHEVVASRSSHSTLSTQRGIDLASLDVSYFTSLSYYILLLFGLRGAFSLVFRQVCGPPDMWGVCCVECLLESCSGLAR